MKIFSIALTLFAFNWASAQEKMKFNFMNEELTKIIDTYSKATNSKMVIDSTVRGNITIMNPNEVTTEEALNQLSEGLAINGFSMNKREDYYVIRNARSAQRDALEISTSLPSLKPQRMATWIVTLKNVPVAEMHSQIVRVALSSYGEMVYNRKSNQIMVSDFTASLHRINSMLLEFDRAEDPRLNKMAEESRKVEDRLKVTKSDDTEKLSEMEIKIKKKPVEKAAAEKPAEASANKDN